MSILPTVKIHALAFLSVAVAMILTVLPIPDWATPFRPEWSILIIIYWCLSSPGNFGLSFAWCTGLFMDLIKGSLLGQYALMYLLIAYICIHAYRQLRVYPLLQQAFWIGALLVLYFTLCLSIDGTRHPVAVDWRYFAPVATSALLWPWVFSTLRLVKQKAETV